MMDGAAPTASPASSSLRQRITYACEACRASKAKCEPTTTEGICRRCFTSKRECIFKTEPRKRRRRSKLHPAVTRLTPPPSVPSKTFTINVPVQSGDDPDGEALDNLDNLKELHERVIELLVSGSDLPEDGATGMLASEASSAPASGGASSAFTPSTSSRSTHSLSSIQPQFNLDSATSLLRSFLDDMLPHFPLITLPSDASIPSLAKDRPFVLLAILAAASSVRSLQGHSLYDEEFRKVLGLKFVSSGERSVELLTGLLIYCAWYPFHLRPKNKQAQQYIHMAGDIVRDLNLDEPPADVDITRLRVNKERMACIRAYLACYYLSSVLASTFQRKHTIPYQQWTVICCSVLDREGDDREAEADRTLAWLVRLGNIVEESMTIKSRPKDMQSDPQHLQLMLKGLEAQLREWQSQMPVDARVVTKPVLRMAHLYAEIVLHGQSLLKFQSMSNKTQPGVEPHVEAERFLRCVNVLRLWLDYIMSLPASEFICFIAIEWGYLVITIILGLKLSFPLPNDCPSWDHAASRKILDLGSFFEKFASIGGDETASATTSDKKRPSVDVLSASKAVIGIVQGRYERRVAALDKVAASYHAAHMMQTMSSVDEEDHRMRKCPMFDGSMDPYLEAWDDTFVNTLDFANPALVVPTMDSDYASGVVNGGDRSNPITQQAGFHDLWATMTMGWGRDGD